MKFSGGNENTGEPFTFTLICYRGKTHSHRSRGDTSREAQRTGEPDTHNLNLAHDAAAPLVSRE
jgi:hypothetical protein